MRISVTSVIQIGLPVVLILLSALIVHKCVHTSANAFIRFPNQHESHHNRLPLHPLLFHRLLMSADPLITKDNNDHHTMVLVGSKGNDLQVTWERDLANDILQRAIDAIRRSDGRPYMVAIAGMPGSGKSSSAEIITHFINQVSFQINDNNNENDSCVCIPADGYHYSVATLQELQIQRNDPTLIYRRGAPDTFDVTALRHDLERIRYPDHHYPNEQVGTSGTTRMMDPSSSVPRLVRLPGFDHALGDPTTHQHVYDRNQHSILIMEGLYLLYDRYQWDQIKDYFDHTIYIQTHSIDTCMERVKERNVCIPGYTVAEIHERVDQVDRNNAILINQASPSRAHQVIRSTTGSSSL